MYKQKNYELVGCIIYADTDISNGYFKEDNSGGGDCMKDKLSGKT